MSQLIQNTLLSTWYVPATLPGARNTLLNETGKNPYLSNGPYINMGGNK